MSQLFASPLGDIRLRPVSAAGWTAALVAAGALHLAFASGWIAWQATRPPAPEAEEDVMVAVALGPPGGRIDPAPAAPLPAPAVDLPKGTRTERAADAPPIGMTAPQQPAPGDAALSSGLGSGGDGVAPAPPPPPPPPAPPAAPPEEPVIDQALLRAYATRVGQLIFDEVRYPESARREEVEGTAILTMLIDRRGNVLKIGLLQSTGHDALDDEILAAAGRVGRFPSLPRGYNQPTLRFSVRIRFTMVDAL